MTKSSPLRHFKTSLEVIRLAVMMYVRFPLSLWNVEDMLHECGIEISHETVRFWWNRFGPMLASGTWKKRVQQLRAYSNWWWHLDEVFVKLMGGLQKLASIRSAVHNCFNQERHSSSRSHFQLIFTSFRSLRMQTENTSTGNCLVDGII